MSDSHRLEEIAAYNDRSLNTLVRAITKSQGRFSLILVWCNYAGLRSQIVQLFHERCSLNVQLLTLKSSAESLYTTILDEFSEQPPDAVMVLGLESVGALDELLAATNKVRDSFSNFAFPVVLWVTDRVLKRLIRVAPDFKSWASPPIEFTLPKHELMAVLQENAQQAFADEPTFSLDGAELKAVQQDLQSQGEKLKPDIQARLAFILGLIHARNQQFDEAIPQYQQSLEYWQESRQVERCCIVLFHIALVYYLKGKEHWEETKSYLQQCLERFEQANHPKLLAKQINKWGELLRQLEAWEELQQLAEKALNLHQDKGEHRQVAQYYSFLAEVDLKNFRWQEANQRVQQALEILDNIPDIESQILGLCYFILAKSQRQLGDRRKAIQNLKIASQVGANNNRPLDQYDPKLYVDILEELRILKFEQGNYLDAFHLKLEQRKTESQYGLRAFIGAGRLEPPRQAINPVVEGVGVRHEVSIEQIVAASGRQKDVEELIERVKNTHRKLTVIYGPSGVGKSSIVQAALVPALQRTYFEGRDFLPVLVQVYKDWVGILGKQLVEALGLDSASFSGDSEVRREINFTAHSSSPLKWTQTAVESAASVESATSPLQRTLAISQGINSLADEHSDAKPQFNLLTILEQLRQNEHRHLLTVLIFDQFEEFFFDNKDQASRQEFYEFLRQCLEIPYLKVILSMREDYIYSLLELSRTTELRNIDTNYEHILYYLGKFSAVDAKAVIQSLTARSHSPLQPDLIEQLVEDLAGKWEKVRPIELQVVGSQLETEKITTLKQYQELGTKPEKKLVERFLEDVVRDCGTENERAAHLVLYLLTNENNIRPFKTQAELAEDLDSEAKKLDLVLEILESSGLVFRVPGVPDDRYQLVHDYLVSFIRQKYQPQSLELEREREKRKRLQKLTVYGMAFLAMVAGIFAWQANERGLETKNEKLEGENQRLKADKQQLEAQKEILEVQKQKLEALSDASKAFFASGQRLEALVAAVKAGKQVKEAKLKQTEVASQALSDLVDVVGKVEEYEEYNRFQEQKGQSAGVLSVSLSSDGKTLASGGDDGTVMLWKLDGTKVGSLSTRSDRVYSVSFSPDRKTLASGSGDGIVTLWELNGTEVREVRSFPTQNARVYSVSFSPDRKTLASGSGDGTVTLWKLDGTKVTSFSKQSLPVYSVSFSPDGKTLASGSGDGTVTLWELNGTEVREVRSLPTQSAGVSSISFNPKDKTLASGSLDETVTLWKLDGTKVRSFPRQNTGVSSRNYSPRGVSFSPDGKTLASGGGDGTVTLWKTDGTKVRSLPTQSAPVYSVSFSPDGQTLASGSGDGTVTLWKLNLDDLLMRSCELLHDYLKTNPKVEESDRTLCDDISTQK
ncbi:MAG: hypothetical protein Fur006_68380 [Coleofasciculaceae cyanobacterium]